MSLYNNSKTRTPIHGKPIKTIRFKQLYPDYESFKAVLAARNIATDKPDAEIVFAYLQEMMGNAYLKFSTRVKNVGFLCWIWQSNLRKYDMYTKFLAKDLEEVANNTSKSNSSSNTTGKNSNSLSDKNNSTNKKFLVNRAANGALEAKFLESGDTVEDTNDQTQNSTNEQTSNSSADSTSQTSLLDRLDEMEQWASLPDPLLRFTSAIASAIKLPYLPDTNERLY